MFGLTGCCTPCPEIETVNVPGIEGPDGTDGTDGTNGVSAFTFTTADFVIPPDDVTPVTVEVEDTSWMGIGEPLFIPNGLFFLVSAIVDGTHVQVTYPDWEANVNSGNPITAGAIVTPSGWQPAAPSLPAVASIAKYADNAGGNYAIQDTAFAEVTFVTSGNQRITLTTAGTWMLYARARIDYTGATFAAVRNVSLKLQRENNGQADVANADTAMKTDIITTLTYTALNAVFPPVMYTTANTTDIIRMMSLIDTEPTAGSLDIVEADIVAVYLHA